jgi:hypothetical protein
VSEALARRRIPSLDRLLREPPVAALIEQFGRGHVTEAARAELDHVRYRPLRQS